MSYCCSAHLTFATLNAVNESSDVSFRELQSAVLGSINLLAFHLVAARAGTKTVGSRAAPTGRQGVVVSRRPLLLLPAVKLWVARWNYILGKETLCSWRFDSAAPTGKSPRSPRKERVTRHMCSSGSIRSWPSSSRCRTTSAGLFSAKRLLSSTGTVSSYLP